MFNFMQSKIELTPRLALAVSVIYMIAVDGNIADEEVGSLTTMFGGDSTTIKNALKYIQQNNDVNTNIRNISSVLNAKQKEVAIINLLDVLLADGNADQSEQQLSICSLKVLVLINLN